MILITLGTQDKSFKRLLEAVQQQIDNKVIREKVIVQAGSTKFESEDMEILDLIPMDEFNKLIGECDLLITHGGVGSITTGLKQNKKVIAAARLSKYEEHTNDHQLEIIEKFVNDKYILELRNFDDLGVMVEKIKTFKPKKYRANNKQMVKILTEYIK